MNFSNINSTTILANYQKWLPAIQWVGGILVTFILAKMFWLWFLYFTTPQEIKPFIVPNNVSSSPSKEVNVSAILAKDLFGKKEVVAARVETQKEAPKTRLNLKLRGIYAADTKSKANAIIEDGRGQQEVYFIDDKLKVSGNVFLREVFPTKVILDTNGRRETLNLIVVDGVEDAIKETQKSDNLAKGGKPRNMDKRNNQRISRQLNDYKKRLLNDPKSVTDVISGRPHFVNGELKGFSVAPGRDVRLFQELGLRRGDLVTSINGVQLTSMQEAMALMGNAQSINSLDVQVERDGQSFNLLLNLNDKVGF